MVGFHGHSVGELIAAFHEAVDDYLQTCMKAGKPAEKAASGKLMLRVDPRIHAASLKATELAGISLNLWSERVLADTVRGATG